MPSHETPKVTIKFDPEGRHVHLSELRRLCDNLSACLEHLAGQTVDGPSPEFSITGLFTGSVGVEVSPAQTRRKEGERVLKQFKRTAKALTNDRKDIVLDARTLELFRKLAFPAVRTNSRLWFDAVPITTQFIANIDKRLDQPVRAWGSLKGVLERVNVHGKNEFFVYPPIRNRGIRCLFKPSLTDTVGSALKRSVTVHGIMLYRGDDAFPYLVEVEEITTHPHDDKLPTLGDLRGIAPLCTGDMTSLEFVRSLQDG